MSDLTAKTEKQNIHKNHRQRTKSRMLREGVTGCEAHQILEALLFYAQPQRDTNETAHLLLERFGSISGVLNASVEELCDIVGIKENAALLIKLAAEMTRRYWQEQAEDKFENKKPLLDTSQKLGDYLISRFIGVSEEQFYLLCLDSGSRMLGIELISTGTVTETGVNFRLVAEKVFRYKAASVVFCHNHPNTNAHPSNNDIKTTIFLRNALAQFNIPVIDHIIVAGNTFTSMSQLEYI